MVTLKPFVFTAFQENTFVLFDESLECVIVDPGMSDPGENGEIAQYITDNQLKPIAMLNTHCHIDHILGCRYIKDTYGVPFYVHPEEQVLLERAAEFGEFFGMQVDPPPMPDQFITEKDIFRFGESELILLHVPGHSPGSLSLYSKQDGFVVVGDALFSGSIGRTDLPGGDYNTLISNIKNKLLTLPRDVIAFPGHGPSTTIGNEYDTNPFLT